MYNQNCACTKFMLIFYIFINNDDDYYKHTSVIFTAKYYFYTTLSAKTFFIWKIQTNKNLICNYRPTDWLLLIYWSWYNTYPPCRMERVMLAWLSLSLWHTCTYMYIYAYIPLPLYSSYTDRRQLGDGPMYVCMYVYECVHACVWESMNTNFASIREFPRWRCCRTCKKWSHTMRSSIISSALRPHSSYTHPHPPDNTSSDAGSWDSK